MRHKIRTLVDPINNSTTTTMQFSLFAIAGLAAATSSSCIVFAVVATAAAVVARKRRITKKGGLWVSYVGSDGATGATNVNLIPIGDPCTGLRDCVCAIPPGLDHGLCTVLLAWLFCVYRAQLKIRRIKTTTTRKSPKKPVNNNVAYCFDNNKRELNDVQSINNKKASCFVRAGTI